MAGEAAITRGRLLWAGVAATAGAAAIGRADGGPLAQPKADEAEILRFFLTLEQVQAAFYAEAVESGILDGELLELATAVGGQEREHVAFLTQRLGGRARPAPKSDFGDAFESPERFRTAAALVGQDARASQVGATDDPGKAPAAVQHVQRPDTVTQHGLRRGRWLHRDRRPRRLQLRRHCDRPRNLRGRRRHRSSRDL